MYIVFLTLLFSRSIDGAVDEKVKFNLIKDTMGIVLQKENKLQSVGGFDQIFPFNLATAGKFAVTDVIKEIKKVQQNIQYSVETESKMGMFESTGIV